MSTPPSPSWPLAFGIDVATNHEVAGSRVPEEQRRN